LQISPVTAVHQALAALAAYDDPATFISLKPEAALLAEAAALEAAGPSGKPLYGLIFAVKDNIDATGLPTTAACPDFAYTPAGSAFVVARLEAAGAIVLGKTNLDQFATGLVGVRSPYGVPRNVQRADLVPGGSSSGSAVAVAAGIVHFALGTDTAGSGRIPAGMNGIVGLKPSLGLFSASGMVPACRTLDTISVFARDVATAFRVTTVAAAYDAADAWSRPLPAPSLSTAPPSLRVGVPHPAQRKFFGDAAAEASYAADLERLAALGAQIVEVDFEPLHAVARLLYEGPWVAERYAATRALLEASPSSFHPVTRKIIEGARGLTAVSVFEATYKLMDLKRAVAPLLARLDCLAVPTVPRAYTVAELAADPITLNSNLGSYTNFVNLLDLAALSVPTADRADGLRGSLTLIGRAGSDGYLAGIGMALTGEATSAPIRAPADRIAPTRRFYAGGGASVRGYSYQAIGPRDLNNDPVGGRSIGEISLEARFRFGSLDQFGIVQFIDAGIISPDPWPSTKEVRVGAGLGFRYYSNFGPIRIDVGTPINPQAGDPRLGVYVSLGQAF